MPLLRHPEDMPIFFQAIVFDVITPDKAIGSYGIYDVFRGNNAGTEIRQFTRKLYIDIRKILSIGIKPGQSADVVGEIAETVKIHNHFADTIGNPAHPADGFVSKQLHGCQVDRPEFSPVNGQPTDQISFFIVFQRYYRTIGIWDAEIYDFVGGRIIPYNGSSRITFRIISSRIFMRIRTPEVTRKIDPALRIGNNIGMALSMPRSFSV